MKLKIKSNEHKFSVPSFEEESGEFDRYDFMPEDLKKLKSQFKEANLKPLSNSIWSKLNNTDSWEVKGLDDLKKFAEQYGRNWESIVDAYRSGTPIPAPIVLHKDGSYELIAGNTRLMAAKALNKTPKVLMLNLGENK